MVDLQIQKISVILPSLNPDEKLKMTVEGLLAVGFCDIVIVNDGSDREHLQNFPEADERITVLTHPVNRGKGAALKTAFAYIKENRPDSLGAVSVDGDGQHCPSDVLHCAEEMVRQGKIILGCRDFSEPQVPRRSRFGNRTTSFVFRLCGMKVSDTQTGLRAFPPSFFDAMLAVEGDRFEYETNMLLAMQEQKLPYAEVKIETVYLEENKTSHFRPVRDSVRIYSLIFAHLFRKYKTLILFAASSLGASLIEACVLALLMLFAQKILRVDLNDKTLYVSIVTLASDILARTVSSLCNFFANRSFVFHSKDPIGKAFLRYYAVALPNMLIHANLTALLKHLPFINTPIRVSILGFAISTLLFVFSYTFQKKWVFHKKKN